jgi:hypothetical protein
MGKIVTLQQSMTALADSGVLNNPVADPVANPVVDPQELYHQQQQQQYEQQQQQLYHPQPTIWPPLPPGPPPGFAPQGQFRPQAFAVRQQTHIVGLRTSESLFLRHQVPHQRLPDQQCLVSNLRQQC